MDFDGLDDEQGLLSLQFYGKLGSITIAAAHIKRTPISISDQLTLGDQDIQHYSLTIFEFLDNNQLSGLDSLFNQLGSVKILVPEDYLEFSKTIAKKITTLFEAKGYDPLTIKKSYYSKKSDTLTLLNQRSSLQTNQHCLNKLEHEKPLTINTIESLWNVIKLRESSVDEIRITTNIGSLDTFMKLDSPAADAVNLMPKADHPSIYGSLYGVLNRCKTKIGSRTLERYQKIYLYHYH